LLEALRLSLTHTLDRHDEERSHRALALVNAFGIVETADVPMQELLALEWPDHTSNRLPQLVLDALLGHGHFRGKRIDIGMSRYGGYMLCSARRLCAIDMLARSEICVAQSYACGKSYKQIAIELGVSPYTVRNQLVTIYQKLGIHEKTELARLLASGDRRRRERGNADRQQTAAKSPEALPPDARPLTVLNLSEAKVLVASADAPFTFGASPRTLALLDR
jgi:DNA-binding CsgD family transcriptional regulator